MFSPNKYHRRSTIALLGLISNMLFAQLDTIYFSPQFIVESKIKSLNMQMQQKKANERITNKSFQYHYFFNEFGKVTKKITYDFAIGSNLRDTTVKYFGYDKNMQLYFVRQENKLEANTYFTTYYIGDSSSFNQKLIKVKEWFKIEEIGLKLLKQDILDSEFVKTIKIKNQEITTVYNNIKLPYLKTIKSRVDSLFSYESKYIVTGVYDRLEILYNQDSTIKQRVEESNINGYEQIVVKYIYDINKLLVQKNTYKNNTLQAETFIYYNNALLDSELSKSIGSNSFDIVKYVYEFYK